MNFLKWWNKFFFKPSFNIFDLLVLLTVVHLITTMSWWWALAYIPTTMFSVIMQIRQERENDSNAMVNFK